MAITRLEYITVSELNSALGTAYDDSPATTLLINEASEIISHATRRKSDYVETDSDEENYLKLATAYQVSYMEDNDDNEYSSSGSESLGRYSYSGGSSGGSEASKISPKTNRYLKDAGLLYCGLDRMNRNVVNEIY